MPYKYLIFKLCNFSLRNVGRVSRNKGVNYRFKRMISSDYYVGAEVVVIAKAPQPLSFS